MPAQARKLRPRNGRILAECVVALALVGVAVAATSTLSRAALSLADDQRLVARAIAAASASAEAATLSACNTAPPSTPTPGRVTHTATDAPVADALTAALHRRIDLTLRLTPLAGGESDSTILSLETGARCPW